VTKGNREKETKKSFSILLLQLLLSFKTAYGFYQSQTSDVTYVHTYSQITAFQKNLATFACVGVESRSEEKKRKKNYCKIGP